MRRDQINIRIPHILKKILIDQENMSQFIIEAIEFKLKQERNPEFIQTRIKELRAEIRELGTEMKDVDPSNIIEGLYPLYQERMYSGATPAMFNNWIRERVKPALVKIGYHGSIEEILKLFKGYKL